MNIQNKKRPLNISAIWNSKAFAISLYGLIMLSIIYGIVSGANSIGYNWQWYRMDQFFYRFSDDGFRLGEIPIGLAATIGLSTTAFILASAIGLIIAIMRLSDSIVGYWVSNVLLEVIRNIPVLVLLYIFYYVFGEIFGLNRYFAGILCLAFYHGILISEIFRAGINAIDKGQWEGAKSIGMSTLQAYRFIIIPQSMRIMTPPLTSEFINLIKSSAIVSVIAVSELTTAGRDIVSKTYMSFEAWFTIAAVYLILTLSLSFFVSYLEKRFLINQN